MSTTWIRNSTRLFFVLLAVSLTGCSPTPEHGERAEHTTHDLIAELAGAELVTEIAAIDPGALDARHPLISGWSQSDKERDAEKPFFWGTGEATVFEWPIFALRDRTLRFECRPFTFPDSPGQTLTFELGGREIARVDLAEERKRYEIELDAEELRLGTNRLRVAYSYSRAPRDVHRKNEDRRSLAVAWYGLRLDPAWSDAPRVVDLERGRLSIPFGAQLDFYLDLQPDSFLSAQWQFDAPDEGRLEISLQRDGGEGNRLARGEGDRIADLQRQPPDGPLRLTDETGGIARLRLRAVREDSTQTETPEAGVVLEAPSIVTTAAPLPAPAATRELPPLPTGTPVIIYMIDTLRADHLGSYGYPADVSPAIDAFADEAVLFENAFAQSSWTRASVASLFTGLWPPRHGANRQREALRSEALTLAEILGSHGYRTAAFVSNINVSAEFGFSQGFDHYEDLAGHGVEVVRRARRWLDAEGEAEEPLFLYVHTVDPHSPYDPPPVYRQLLAPEVPASVVHRPERLLADMRSGKWTFDEQTLNEAQALYAAEVAHADESFARLREDLESRGLWDQAVVMVISDHGEEFYEHQRFGHGKTLYDESTRVPWILKLGADGPSGRISRDVQLIDLLPTLLPALGIPTPPGIDGRDLRPTLLEDAGGTALAADQILTYLHYDGMPWVGIRQGGFLLTQRRLQGRWMLPQLFDLAADPGQLENLADERPVVTGYLAAELRRRLLDAEARGLEPQEIDLDDDLRRGLEALGYL